MWGNGMGYGMAWWMWVVMGLGTLGFWALVAYLVRAVIQGRPETPATPTSTPTSTWTSTSTEPLRLLDERLARGDIEFEEYQRIRNVLTNAH